MSEPIVVTNTNTDGTKAVSGRHAIDPHGNLVKLPPRQLTLEDGWRWATEEDLDAKTKRAAELDAAEGKVR